MVNSVEYYKATKVKTSFPCSGLYPDATAVNNTLGYRNLMPSEHHPIQWLQQLMESFPLSQNYPRSYKWWSSHLNKSSPLMDHLDVVKEVQQYRRLKHLLSCWCYRCSGRVSKWFWPAEPMPKSRGHAVCLDMSPHTTIPITYRGASLSHRSSGPVVCKDWCLAGTPVHHGCWALTEDPNTRNWTSGGKRAPTFSSKLEDRNVL